MFPLSTHTLFLYVSLCIILCGKLGAWCIRHQVLPWELSYHCVFFLFWISLAQIPSNGIPGTYYNSNPTLVGTQIMVSFCACLTVSTQSILPPNKRMQLWMTGALTLFFAGKVGSCMLDMDFWPLFIYTMVFLTCGTDLWPFEIWPWIFLFWTLPSPYPTLYCYFLTKFAQFV